VRHAAEILQIAHLLDRKPKALSGGQRQRVAIGRAIVRKPEVFLFDEPLSNLDAALRAQTRVELARLHKELKATMIYVTHDQVEAMGMGDRIAVIDHGLVRQVGTPTEIYDDPADRFVATFVGTPPMNIVAKNGGYLGFRPENFLPKDMIDDGAFTEFKFRVDRSEYLGSERIVYGVMEGFDPNQVITAKLPPAHVADDWIRPGEWHAFAVRNSALRNFDKDGKRSSRH
jgi:multiple sugar transport system ATP-binding protein